MRSHWTWALLLCAIWPALAVFSVESNPSTSSPSCPAPNPLKDQLQDLEVKGDWIYNDLQAGLAEARKTGKPLLVVIRCVP